MSERIVDTDSVGNVTSNMAICRACGSKNLRKFGRCREFGISRKPLFQSYYDLENLWGFLYRCCVCGLGMRIPCLNEEQLYEIYAAMDEDTWKCEFESNSAWVLARNSLLQYWEEKDEPLVLDIGCNKGDFLRGLPHRWKKFGIEPGQKKYRLLKSYGIKVIANSLNDVPTNLHGFFDVVCMFNVFEHLLYPKSGLLNAIQYLKPGGKLIISTGNMDAWTWKWLGTEHWYLESPLHLSYGNPTFFNWFCGKAPVSLVSVLSVSHKLGSFCERSFESVVAIYFGLRMRGGLWRILQRAIQTVPTWKFLMHKQSMPSTFYLKDHILVVFKRILE